MLKPALRRTKETASVATGEDVSTLDYLGLNPSPYDVQKWFKEAGFTTRVVGKSIKKRDLRVFRKIIEPEVKSKHMKSKTVLFVSLIHGNEPLSLISLLRTAEALSSESFIEKYSSDSANTKLDLLFFPIVNVDAYELNLEHGSGCRRTNLKHACKETKKDLVKSCPYMIKDGVDLNRNFGVDFPFDTKGDDLCAHNSAGNMPFSEPETRAIKDLVLKHQPTASVIFHSWADSNERPLIYYPYTSHLPHKMDAASKLRFERWGEAMNPTGVHSVGRSKEAGGFTGIGSPIDWMFDEAGVAAFVHTAATPCGERWCDDKYASEIKQNSLVYAQSSVNLVDMVMAESQLQSSLMKSSRSSRELLLPCVSLVAIAVLYRTYKKFICPSAAKVHL